MIDWQTVSQREGGGEKTTGVTRMFSANGLQPLWELIAARIRRQRHITSPGSSSLCIGDATENLNDDV
jgi:hypothetical protein